MVNSLETIFQKLVNASIYSLCIGNFNNFFHIYINNQSNQKRNGIKKNINNNNKYNNKKNSNEKN